MPMQLPPGIAALSGRLSQIGFERTRRALAGLALSIFVSLYLLVALNAPDGFGRVFVALSFCYGVAFLGVVAEWFWGRWFATGLAWSGVMIAIAAMVMLGWEPQLAIFGGLHLLVVLSLIGKKMATRYDLQEAWRSRYKVDEFGVARLQKAVTSAAASLPSLIIATLAPKEDGLGAAGLLAATLLVVAGLRGLTRLRSWGVLAIGGAAAIVGAQLVGTSLFGATCDGMVGRFQQGVALHHIGDMVGAPLAFVFLAAAALPFARDIARFLRRA
jgi:hypothetical protein